MRLRQALKSLQYTAVYRVFSCIYYISPKNCASITVIMQQGDCRTYSYVAGLSSDTKNPNWENLYTLARIIPRVCTNVNRYIDGSFLCWMHCSHLYYRLVYMHTSCFTFTSPSRESMCSSYKWSCSALSPVSTGMGDCLRVGIPPRYVTKPSRSTQPCIPPGSLNRVPTLIGWGKGGNVTSAEWQVTLCDPTWHVSSTAN